MRKKSHISVAKYLMNSVGMEILQTHKKAFYMGSILPDCTVSFLTKRHSMDETFDVLKKEIKKITEEYDLNQGINAYYCRHLGVVTHYIADYFTFPHNVFYDGNMKDHCLYEKELKYCMREYVKSKEAQRNRQSAKRMHTVEEICNFIQEMHGEYAKAIKEVKIDCEYIVSLCHRVVDAILLFFESGRPMRSLVAA